jgi:hypothetical protein
LTWLELDDLTDSISTSMPNANRSNVYRTLVHFACPFFFWSLYCLSMFLLVVVLSVHVYLVVVLSFQYNDQKKYGQTIQRPKETWTGNTTTKRNMVFLLVVVLPVHVSFGRCIVCPCFFWSLYCLSMLLIDRQYNGQKKHGQAIQLPKET